MTTSSLDSKDNNRRISSVCNKLGSEHTYKILHCLIEKEYSYTEMKFYLEMKTNKTQLTRVLTSLIDLGLIEEKEVGTIEARWRYYITPKGRRLEPVLDAMIEADKYL